MNLNSNTDFTTTGLLTAVLTTVLLITGCSTTSKSSTPNVSSQTVTKSLTKPSISYLSEATEASQRSADVWIAIAKKNYEAKHYARALRAANEALNIDKQKVEARQIAMLSAVKVMESNIDAYHNDVSMNKNEKATLKETLTNITSLSSASL